MKPMVLITGSEGLIGSALAGRLAGRYEVVGFDQKRSVENDGLRTFIYCDLTREESVRQSVECLKKDHGARIASVVHLAAYYDFSGSESPLYEELTVGGTRRLLGELRNLEVEQFVFSSTMLVMRPSGDGPPIDETSPLDAEWPYPQSKIRAEETIAGEHGDIPVVVLRIAGVYDDVGRAVPIVQQIKRIYEKELEGYFFPGDASHGQSLVHLDDLTDAIERTIARRAELDPFETFLIGEPEVMPYRELQDQLGELLHGKEWPSIRIPEPVAKIGAQLKEMVGGGSDVFIKPWMIDLADQDYRIDISRAREKLGWKPRRSLREGLPLITGTLLDDPEAWYRENGLEAPERVRS